MSEPEGRGAPEVSGRHSMTVQPDKRAAYPGAPDEARSFDDEISAAVRYEKGLAVKALAAIALVAAILAICAYLLG
jgi:hypothetical protein